MSGWERGTGRQESKVNRFLLQRLLRPAAWSVPWHTRHSEAVQHLRDKKHSYHRNIADRLWLSGVAGSKTWTYFTVFPLCCAGFCWKSFWAVKWAEDELNEQEMEGACRTKCPAERLVRSAVLGTGPDPVGRQTRGESWPLLSRINC